jgi:hypothetical protein
VGVAPEAQVCGCSTFGAPVDQGVDPEARSRVQDPDLDRPVLRSFAAWAVVAHTDGSWVVEDVTWTTRGELRSLSGP